MAKSRLEIIVETIVSSGTAESKEAAWKYLRSESARAEAEMIDVSNKAQQDIIAIIGQAKPKKIASYDTKGLLDDVRKRLGIMLGDLSVLSRRLVTANILAGKLKSLSIAKLKEGEDFAKKVALNQTDIGRIDKLSNDLLERYKRGASLTLSSVTSTIQNTSIRANMPGAIQTGNQKNGKQEAIKQEPISIEFVGEAVDQKKAQKSYQDAPLSLLETIALKRSPVLFAQQQSRKNVATVKSLHKAFISGNTKDDPMDSKKLREKALKEAKGSPADKATFELNKTLRSQGLSAFVDKGGRRWTLASYCAMSTRTTAAQSTNLGEVFANEEHDLYYIVPHGGTCPLCSKFEGKVYSRSGTSKKYPPLASAFSKIDPNGPDTLENTYMTIHPNCRHKVIRYFERTSPSQNKNSTQSRNKGRGIPKAAVPTMPIRSLQRQENIYEKRQKLKTERLAAQREFQTFLQILPLKDVCSSFDEFFKHWRKKDGVYKTVRQRYSQALKAKKEQEQKSFFEKLLAKFKSIVGIK